jgi:hypothetical protein
VVGAVKVPSPVKFNTPLFAESPSVMFPPIDNVFTTDRADVESLETIPPPNVNMPVPNAELLATYTRPAFTVAPPLNVLAPLNVNAPAPNFVSDPGPLKSPVNSTTLVNGIGVVSVTFEDNVPAPLSVSDPVFVASPKLTVPPSE